MLVDGISRQQLQQNAIDALAAANTLAGTRVYEPRDWPTTVDQFPMLLVQTPRERKASLGRGVPQFNTTITLAVVGRVVRGTPEKVSADLDTLSGQIEDALICNQSFMQNVQQHVSIETRTDVTADGRQHIGEIGMIFEVEVYQVYGPDTSTPFLEIQGTVTSPTSGETLTSFDVKLPQS